MKALRYIAKCKTCGIATSGLSAGQDMQKAKGDPTRGGAVYTHTSGSHVIDCRKCGQPKYAKMVIGIYSAKHTCNARCMSSTGFQCECSCAGKNHGAAHSG